MLLASWPWSPPVAKTANAPVESVGTIADLIARKPPRQATTITVAAYSSASKSGGGTFVFDPASTAAPDGGIVIKPSKGRARGRWLRQTHGIVKPEWFGAMGDGATDDRAAIASALAAAASGTNNVLSFSAKTYRLASIDPNSPSLVGQPAMIAWAAPSAALVDLEIRGNGATLFSDVRDGKYDQCGAILGLKFNPGQLTIERLKFERAHRVINNLSNTGYQGLAFQSFDATKSHSIEIAHCRFINCHRAYDIEGSGSGNLRSLSVHDCKLLYPYASNTNAAGGGGQGERAGPWVKNYQITRCFFDGGADGNASPNGLRKDGLDLSAPRHLTIQDSTLQNFDVEGIYDEANPRIDFTAGAIKTPGPGKPVVLPTSQPGIYAPGQAIAIGNSTLSGGTFFTVQSVKKGKVVLRQNEDSRNEATHTTYPSLSVICGLGTMGSHTLTVLRCKFIGRSNPAAKDRHLLGNVGIVEFEGKATLQQNQIQGIACAIDLKTFFPYEVRNAGSVISQNQIQLPPLSTVGVGVPNGISLAGPSKNVQIMNNTIDLGEGDGAKGIDLNGTFIDVEHNTITATGNPSTFKTVAYGIALGNSFGGMSNIKIIDNTVKGTTLGVGGGPGTLVSVQGLQTENVLTPVQTSWWLTAP